MKKDSSILYKDPKSYKGFEIWYHALQMSVKMHLYVFLICLTFHLIIPFLYLMFFDFETIQLMVWVITSFHFKLIPKMATVLFHKGFVVFILSSPIWFLYPILLVKFKKKSSDVMKDKHLRGQELVSLKELIAAIKKEHKIQPDCFKFAEIPIPYDFETTHFLLVGRSGSGKTTLLNQIVETIRHRRCKAVVVDTKGDYISKFYNPETDLIFNPLDSRTLNWNIFDELSLISDIESFSFSLIPPVSHGHEDQYFIDGAREVFMSILYYLYATDQRNMRLLWECLSQGQGSMVQTLKSAVASGLEECKRGLGYLEGYDKDTRSASDVISTVKKYANCFSYTRHHISQFSVNDWIKKQDGGMLFIVNYEKIKNVLKPLVSVLIEQLGNAALTLADDRERRIFFILDEFASLQRMPTFISFLERGRSKGISLWISLQDINQLKSEYGENRMNTIINNCTTMASFAVQDVNSCEYLSRLFGEREILETDESLSMGPDAIKDGLSITRKRNIERIILPSEFTKLPTFNFYLKLANYQIVKHEVKFKQYPAVHEHFIPDVERLKISTVTIQDAEEKITLT